MTERLKEVMREIGEQAPPLSVAEDVWRRGRRARMRDVVLAPAAAAVVLVLLAAVVWSGYGSRSTRFAPAEQAPSTQPALPTTLYGVPDWVDTPTTDLAVGPVSALWLENGHPDPVVAVSAVDGSYRLLRLPGFDAWRSTGPGDFAQPEGAALSPDGTRVAYWWQESPSDGQPVPSGVRIADLATGEVATYPIEDGAGVFVSGLSWSSNGTYLSATVMAQETWTETGSSGRFPTYVVRLDTRAGDWARWPADGVLAAAMSQDGMRLAYPSGQETLVVTGMGEGSSRRYEAVGFGDARSLVWSPDGHRIAYVDGAMGQLLTVRPGKRPVATASNLGQRGQQVLGWEGPMPTVWYPGSGGGVLAAGDRATSDEATRTRLQDLGDVEWLSVATGLLDAPRADFAEPDWPMNPRWKVAALVATAGLLLLGFLWWRLRERRRRRAAAR